LPQAALLASFVRRKNPLRAKANFARLINVIWVVQMAAQKFLAFRRP
jgi:hypothetical protein